MAIFGEERLAPANGIEIAYQEAGDPGDEPLLLIMGLGTQMIAWEEGFCELLVERGFRVIRFDNRDIGHSTMLDEAGVPKRIEMMRGRRSTAAYLLDDMAEDGFGLMDHLGVESAHVTGASMGGMIAQTMAIRRPQRVRSLVSMMSTTGNRRLGWPTLRAMRILFADYPRSRQAYVARAQRTFDTIGSPAYPTDRERLARLAGEMYDRSHNPGGVLRQMHAITASGDRTPRLRRLELPTTVIHGSRDPLVRPVAGRATARAIPGARLRVFEGMGHDLPQELWPEFAAEIAAAAQRAGSRIAQPPDPQRFGPTISSSLATSALRETQTETALDSDLGKAAVQRRPRQSHAEQKMQDPPRVLDARPVLEIVPFPESPYSLRRRTSETACPACIRPFS